MKITQITFSLARTMPLDQLSRDAADRYANIKPFASCTIAFDADDATEVNAANAKIVQEIVRQAYTEAQREVFESMKQFSDGIRKLYAKD